MTPEPETFNSTAAAIIILLAIFGYIFPALVAIFLNHPNKWIIAFINLSFGYTGVVWVLCFIAAFIRVDFFKSFRSNLK